MTDPLDSIAVDEVAYWQQMALVRLHLFVTGETHRLLNQFLDNLRPAIDKAADEEGNLQITALPALTIAAQQHWQACMASWLQMVMAARRQAAWIPFGQLARLHQHYLGEFAETTESAPAVQILHALLEDGPEVAVGYPDEPGPINQVRPFVYDHAGFILRGMQARIDGILNGAEAIKYSDGKTFSDRTWSLEHGGLQGILTTVQQAAAEGRSAWDTAHDLEQYLGFGQDCPRWTWERLYKLTKTDIALGDETGLVRNPCDGSGVAYNALRLARNEIQIGHHIVTDQTFAAMPWIEQEQIVLSPSHPPIGCACEDVVAGGENGDGVYPKGEIVLPIHVHCLCFKLAVLMPMDEFVGKLAGWVNGSSPWAAMDEYLDFLSSPAEQLGATTLAMVAAGSWLMRWAQETDKSALGQMVDQDGSTPAAKQLELDWALEQLEQLE
ncbi:MAG: hypothetical protein JXA14_22840 [Anaerolineae bacterium]|nr:hypothetical protein [Anaerolineae bacterium]